MPLPGKMPGGGSHDRENEAAGDLADASSQAVKRVKNSLHTASFPGTEAIASEDLGGTGECGHEWNETNGDSETLTLGSRPRGAVF